jgi:hypothetical protein
MSPVADLSSLLRNTNMTRSAPVPAISGFAKKKNEPLAHYFLMPRTGG